MAGWGGHRSGAGAKRLLSDWEVEEMRSLRRRGASLRELASLYGVCERTVGRYLREYGRKVTA